METRKDCPKCGKKMVVKYSSVVLMTYPAQYPWDWWCGCGYTEKGGIEGDSTYESIAREEWERVNEEK